MKVLKFTHYTISENLIYHLDNNISVLDNIFRPGSDAFFSLLKEARENFNNIELLDIDRQLFENTDLGEFVEIDGQMIPLDLPMLDQESINEAEYKGKKVKLNKPMRNTGSGKKYKVYVKNPKTGKVKVVRFGDLKGGLASKINDPEARRDFAKRHKCKDKKDKTKPGYWSCNLPRYAKYLGLSGGGNFYW